MEFDSVTDFVEEALRSFDTESLGGIPEGEAAKGLSGELRERLSLNDPETLRARHERFAVPGAKPEDFREREVVVSGRRRILAGVRHFGGDRDRPFVDCWQGYPLESWDDLRSLAGSSRGHFEVFSPLHLRLWLNPKSHLAQFLDTKEAPAVSQNLMCVAGCLIGLKSLKPLQNLERIQLVEETLDWSWYESLYRDFHARMPALQDLVPVNSRDDMETSAKDGLLRVALIDGKRAGVVAGWNMPLLGQKALHMSEITLSREFQGKGLAASLQWTFLNTLPADYRLVWGTIDRHNQPSMRTALRLGRKVIRKEYFVAISDLLA